MTLQKRVVTAEQLNRLNKKNLYVFKTNEALELREVTKKNSHTGEDYTKQYLVHKIDGLKDTLFKISYFYNVPIKTIQFDNQFCGDDIFYMKELLIEYKGQDVVIREEDLYKKKEVTQKQDEAAIIMKKLSKLMFEYMEDLFKKNLMMDQSLYDPNANYDNKAQMYLDEESGNKEMAFTAWKKTLQLNMKEVLIRGADKSGCKKVSKTIEFEPGEIKRMIA